ncbi:hypothetical protein NX02_00525 [Sphingomonas sanxanigenens DSM 19645 = NX02]|uniref:Uncharacterized protein n=1 Tax=Sphingomonas sanxanigenens DSM 19645 = NX02 TaxID=1123269 RepID=W0A6A0_9SPHN|nr:hypothetical protein NX02_00525 [Sphingomonas sanxanigenens DSM 19645 = NX02]
MASLRKTIADNKDVAFVTILTVGLITLFRAMILSKLAD